MSPLKKLFPVLLILANVLGNLSFAEAAAMQSNQMGQNLLLYSEQFDNAAWTAFNSGVNIAPNDVLAPDGTKTADRVVFDPNGFRYQTTAGVATYHGKTFTCSAWLYSPTKATISLRAFGNNSNSPTLGTVVNLTPGWQRFQRSITLASNDTAVTCGLDDRAGVGGDGLGGTLYIWGGQLVFGTGAGFYNKTTASALNASFRPYGPFLSDIRGQNLLTYSEQLDNGAWLLQAGVSVTPNATRAPDGTPTADLVDLTAAAANQGIYHYVFNINGRQNTKSIWLKGVLGTEVVTLFDPVAAGASATCTLSTSWQRCFFTDAAGAQPGNGGIWIRKSSGNQIYAWGGQLVYGSKPAAYNPTIASALNTTFVPTSATRSRQLGQNLVTYSEQFDNAGWTKRGTTTITANAIQAPDGTKTADLIAGLALPGVNDMFQSVTTGNSRRYTPSFYIKKVSTTGTITIGNSSTANLGQMSLDLSLLDSGWNRITVGHPATTLYHQFISHPSIGEAGIHFTPSSTGSYSFYLWGVQEALGSSAGYYNKTAASAFNGSYVP